MARMTAAEQAVHPDHALALAYRAGWRASGKIDGPTLETAEDRYALTHNLLEQDAWLAGWLDYASDLAYGAGIAPTTPTPTAKEETVNITTGTTVYRVSDSGPDLDSGLVLAVLGKEAVVSWSQGGRNETVSISDLYIDAPQETYAVSFDVVTPQGIHQSVFLAVGADAAQAIDNATANVRDTYAHPECWAATGAVRTSDGKLTPVRGAVHASRSQAARTR